MTARFLDKRFSHFVLAAFVLVTACAAITRSQAFAANPDVAAWGVTFDLTITLPLLYWFFVVRRRKASVVTLAPVFLVGTFLASALLPSSQQHFVHVLKMTGGAAAEIALVAGIMHRVRRSRRDASASTDPYERITSATRMLFGERRVASVVASEITIIYFAIFGWRRKPEQTDGIPFTVHERAGWTTILACIIVLIVAEGIGLHLLVGIWSAKAAWIATALDVWGIAWLLGDYQALRLRRSFVSADGLHLRYGMRWSVDVAVGNIAAIDEVRREEEWKRRDTLRVAILDEPRWLVTLHEPIIAHGLAGMTKEIRAIALLPDDEEAISALRRAAGQRPRDTRADHR